MTHEAELKMSLPPPLLPPPPPLLLQLQLLWRREGAWGSVRLEQASALDDRTKTRFEKSRSKTCVRSSESSECVHSHLCSIFEPNFSFAI